ncbi:hypothetical protein E2C01_001955 [Portunus trituberculatus]|uniref:Uncharacterized protein n=1 Tax=Portunus trituberculatus TaxID=210409 RepID=A0A5B7CII6_PORTR|nr:hypothetical protein [Portunus trituberculatus]
MYTRTHKFRCALPLHLHQNENKLHPIQHLLNASPYCSYLLPATWELGGQGMGRNNRVHGLSFNYPAIDMLQEEQLENKRKIYSTTRLVQRILCILCQDSRQTSDESMNYPCVLVEAGHKPLYTGGLGQHNRRGGHHQALTLTTSPHSSRHTNSCSLVSDFR